MDEHDPILSPNAASRFLPDGRRVDASTWWRWHRVGLKARDGRIVRLTVTRCGGRLGIRRSDLERFFAELAGNGNSAPRHSTVRSRELQRVERELDAAGI